MFGKRFHLSLFFIVQIFIALMVSIGVWPHKFAFLALVLQLLAILFFDLEYALYSVILSVPVSLALPLRSLDSFASWRLGFAFLFLVYLFKGKIIRLGKPDFSRIRFAPWDKYLLFFVIAVILSIFFAPFKVLALKKIIFLANAYVIYFLAYNILRTRETVKRAIIVTFVSLVSVVLFGFIQYAFTYSTNHYYFWQYWATYVARFFYGSTFADTSLTSNSWFAYQPGQPPSLRMFSVLPDSHSFALIAMLTVPFASTVAFFAKQKWQKVILFLFVFLSAWAMVLSGTRGVWAGSVPVLALLLILYFKKKPQRIFLKKVAAPIVVFIVMIFISPFLQQGLNYVAHRNAVNDSLQRAESIYDFGETSNSGRIFIWKNTLKYALHHPIVGAGFGNFIETLKGIIVPDTNSSDYSSLALSREKRYNLPAKYITAHDLYLDVLAETGLLGFIAFALYFKSILGALYSFFKNTGDRVNENPHLFFVSCFAVYLIWLLAYSVVDGTLFNDRVLIYFFIALAISGVTINLEKNNV